MRKTLKHDALSTTSIALFAAMSALLAACGVSAEPTGKRTEAASGEGGKPFVATPVATFDQPWAMTFLPDGRMLVTEKSGKLKLVSADGKSITVATGMPPVDSEGQGGLMDVVLAPGYATKHQQIYFSYVERGPGGKGVVLARADFNPDIECVAAPCPPEPEVTDTKVLFRAQPFVEGDGHFSGRIAFSPDGQYLFFTNGERQKFTPAQDPKATLGKVLRLLPDGRPAPGNPLAAKGFHPAIWSYGHRNLLGLAFDASGNLWEQEMGPKGGDEVNLILPGRNYGYPNASNGSHYDGRDIPDHRPGDGYEAPKVWWNPVISPAGLMIYSGSMFPQWRGNAFIGGLSSEALVRVVLNGDRAAKASQYPMGARIREVEQGPDGAIYVLEDGKGGRLLKLTPPQG